MLTTAFIVAFIVYFIHATFWPQQIFGPLSNRLDKIIPEKLRMPLYDCPICMTPWWGTAGYLVGHYAFNIELFSDARWYIVVMTVFCAAGINTVMLQVNRIANTLKEWKDDSKNGHSCK